MNLVNINPSLHENLQVLQNLLMEKNEDTCMMYIHNICINLWQHNWEEDFGHTMIDPTLRYLAFSQLKHQGGFNEPHLTTPDIAKLEFNIRLTFVYEIWRIGKTAEEPISSIELSKKLSRWLTESHSSTFSSLRSLQHVASSIAYSTMGLPKIWWPESGSFDKMLYKGNNVELSDICKALAQMEVDMAQLWEKNILMGLKLRIDYEHLVDNLSNVDVGYSLFSDDRNPCFKNAANLLASAIMQDPTLKNRFIKGTTNDGKPIWNVIEFRKWLIKYAEFEEILLTKSELTAGSSARGTEITTLLWKNTATRPFRGLFMMGKHLAYLCQYHKTSALTLRDKTVPHAFDAHTADLIIQNLAIARPFAQLAAYICFPGQLEIHQAYDSYLFINFSKPFSTTDITNCLQKYTAQFIGHPIGMRDWRHISIAFRRKLSSAMEDLIEEEQNETIAAAQSHHSRSTENRIYGISPGALAVGQPEDILPLFLKHSTDWQEVCRVERGGCLKSYQKCFAKDQAAKPTTSPKMKSPMAQELFDLLTPMLVDVVKTTIGKEIRELEV